MAVEGSVTIRGNDPVLPSQVSGVIIQSILSHDLRNHSINIIQGTCVIIQLITIIIPGTCVIIQLIIIIIPGTCVIIQLIIIIIPGTCVTIQIIIIILTGTCNIIRKGITGIFKIFVKYMLIVALFINF